MAKGRDSGPKRDRTRTANSMPNDDPLSDIPPPPTGHPRNLTETEAFRKSKSGAGRMWNNYKLMLSTSFQRMSRYDQEAMLTKASVIITIGVTILALSLFYSLIPSQIRIFLVPGAIGGAWWIGGKVVSHVIIQRCEPFLNKADY